MPVFHKYYDIPYTFREPVEKQIRKMFHEGWLVPVTHSEWSSNIWPILRKDGILRTVVDFKKTVNPQIRVDQCPLPKAKDIFYSLCGSSQFTVLDLS